MATSGQASGVRPASRPGIGIRLGRSLRESSTGLVSFVILVAALEAGLRLFDVPAYILPTPSAIFEALIRGFSTSLEARNGYYIHIGATLAEAIGSFTIGSLLGIVLGAAVVEFALARKLVLPYMIALQSVPKVALAPLLVVWFGFGLSSKIVLGVLLTVFPLMINTAAGLASVERERIELMQSLRAGPWKTFRLVQLPSALPYIFAGLEMAAAYAVLGAVVGEFVGGRSGLGVLILNRNAALDIAGSLAALVLLAVMGIALQRSVTMLRRKLLFWAPSQDGLRFDAAGDKH
jgi:NitT/TauT family transport system permease protein